MEAEKSDRLLILWTSAEKQTAEKMVFMYALNAKVERWWDEVTLLLWGPSSRLTAEDPDLAREIEALLSAGVRVIACKQCADGYGITQKLSDLGIEVFYTGVFLTEWIKSGRKYLTI